MRIIKKFNLLILLLLLLFFGFYLSLNKTLNSNQKITLIKNQKPLIVFYTPIFGKTVFKNAYVSSLLKTCSSFSCQISDNPLDYPNADVAVFHPREINMTEFLYNQKNPNRLNVFFTLEAFPHEKIRRKRFPKDFFNVTATFLKNSNLWMPYEKFHKILPHEKGNETLIWSEKDVENAISKKEKLAVIFVSHCLTHSFREKLIADMQIYANISTFGSCYNSTNFNVSQELGKHFFYLAFENSLCKDYVTEKFWRIKDLIVPVVMKRLILKGIVEDEYFIAADDFNSTKAMVDRLIYLSKNISEYKTYFGWTKIYKKGGGGDESELCQICDMAVKKEKHSIPDIYQWWEEKSQCQFNYLNFTLKYLKANNLFKVY